VVPVAGASAGAGATAGATTGATTGATNGPTTAPPATTSTPVTAQEAAALRDMMRAVVTEGSGKLLLDVPAPDVLAKSGTAQFGSQDDLRNHVWMIAIHGDLAVAVFVDEGDFGSTTSGPLLKQFLLIAG